MEEFIREIRFICEDLENIKVKDNSENAEAIKALKSAISDLAECLGNYMQYKK